MNKKGNPYEILGVRQNAEEEVIKAAYRALARKYHPDVNHSPGAEETFKTIADAYERVMAYKRGVGDSGYNDSKGGDFYSEPNFENTEPVSFRSFIKSAIERYIDEMYHSHETKGNGGKNRNPIENEILDNMTTIQNVFHFVAHIEEGRRRRRGTFVSRK